MISTGILQWVVAAKFSKSFQNNLLHLYGHSTNYSKDYDFAQIYIPIWVNDTKLAIRAQNTFFSIFVMFMVVYKDKQSIVYVKKQSLDLPTTNGKIRT